MRESNFSFPSTNRACVCITSQLYDRRALDTTSSLPLLNSLTHLTYLTSTSPRIRETLTLDGGLERLVRLLRQYCAHPVAPAPGLLIYHLTPSSLDNELRKPGQPVLTASSGPSVDRAKTYQFSLAFQCVVNIGVRGSETIRSRVVQAGMLDVVASVLETWLKSKGFALGPSSTGSGAPRESKEERHARKKRKEQEAQQRARELSQAIAHEILAGRAVDAHLIQLNEQVQAIMAGNNHLMTAHGFLPFGHSSIRQLASDEPASGGSHSAMTSGDESGGVDADGDEEMADAGHMDRPSRPASLSAPPESVPMARSMRPRASPHGSTSAETSAENTPVRSGTPTATVVVSGRDRSGTVVGRTAWDGHPNGSEREGRRRTRRGVSAPEEDEDEDVMEVEENEEHAGGSSHQPRAVGIVDAGDGGMDMMLSPGIEMPGAGVAQGLVALDANDDLAMGAPPGAPGAQPTPTITMPLAGQGGGQPRLPWDEPTPRAMLLNLPTLQTAGNRARAQPTNGALRGGTVQRTLESLAPAGTINAEGKQENAKYRDDDVLIALQLLAYLSKYPHIRQAFYRPRDPYYPVPATEEPKPQEGIEEVEVASSVEEPRRPRRDLRRTDSSASGSPVPGQPAPPPKPIPTDNLPMRPALSTTSNLFSLVERFTFRPSPSEPNLPALPKDIQYWAGVIMRNACRKDESRGGIRQCANMSCGKWEDFPREFAKCRRCRKAKYCGKECQSRAWAEGHRFWCNQREDNAGESSNANGNANGNAGSGSASGDGAGGMAGGDGAAPAPAGGAPGNVNGNAAGMGTGNVAPHGGGTHPAANALGMNRARLTGNIAPGPPPPPPPPRIITGNVAPGPPTSPTAATTGPRGHGAGPRVAAPMLITQPTGVPFHIPRGGVRIVGQDVTGRTRELA